MSDIPSLDIQKTNYLSKEEITEKTGVSPHTLQNWINSDKPTDTEFETLRSGKRTYSTIYIKKIFTNANRHELWSKLRDNESLANDQSMVDQNLISSQPMPNQWLTNQPQEPLKPFDNEEKPLNNEVIVLVNQKWQASVTGKEEVIVLLKEQLDSMKQQIDSKDGQIADLSKNLNQQQILQMETIKEVVRLREENKNLLLTSQEATAYSIAESAKPDKPAEAGIVHNTPVPQSRKKWWLF